MGSARYRRDVLVPALLMVVYAGCLLPLVPQAADDVRMADVFSVDEAGAAVVVRHLYRRGSPELETFSYGGLFYYLPLGVLKLLGGFGLAATDRAILVTLRSLCLAAALGCLWLTYRIGLRAFGFGAAVSGALLLAATPTFVRWSVEAHPDLPQLFWMLCALVWTLRLREAPNRRAALLAGLFAGLAAGTKYAGAFLTPLVAAALFLPSSIHGFAPALRSRLESAARWKDLGAVTVAFAAAFVLTNPYALVHYDRFRADVVFERSHLSFGHMFRTATGGLGWVSGLVQASGRLAAAAFLGAMGLALWRRVARRDPLPPPQGLLLLWMVGYTGYLVMEVNLQAGRHLLPVLPVFLLFAGYGIQLAGGLADRAPFRHRGVAALTAILTAAVLWGPLAGSAQVYSQKDGRAERRSEIAAGRWIAETFPEDTTILYDAYGYVPGRFTRVYRTFGMSYPMVNHFQPELLVVRSAIASRYAAREDAWRFREGEGVYLDRHYFYRYLSQDRIPDYAPLKAFDGVTVYRRSESAPRRPELDRTPWLDLVKLYGAGRLYGLPEARMRMGDVQMAAGRWAEAAREYGLVTEMAPGNSVAHYSLAQACLRADRLKDAREAFGRALSLVADRPDAYRAAVRTHIAREYLAAGWREEAQAQLRKALALDPEGPAAGLLDAQSDAHRSGTP